MSQPATGSPTQPWGSGPHSIKRHGTTLATCDSEPVQTPGCIQAHGALLANALKYKRPAEAHVELRYTAANDATARPKAPAASARQDIFDHWLGSIVLPA